MDRWREKVAVVTGASEGIGAAIVRRLAKDGMKVAALARRADLLETLERDLRKSDARVSLKGYVCDVRSVSDVMKTLRSIESDLGFISILINNAGVFRESVLTDLDLEAVEALVDTNLTGVLYCTKMGLASMRKHSNNESHIVNISSIAAHWSHPEPCTGVYTASKHAQNVVSETLWRQLKQEKSNTRLTIVSPGLVKTSATAHMPDTLQLGQYMLPEDVADAVVYALSAPAHVNVSEIIIENVDELPLASVVNIN